MAVTMRMASSGMLRNVTLVTTDISEERIALLVTVNVPSSSILVNLTMEAIRPSEMSVLTGTTLRNTPEDDILQFISCFDIGKFNLSSEAGIAQSV
jgi:hypothetical protein